MTRRGAISPILRAGAALALLALPAAADQITALPYDALSVEAPQLLNFDRLPPKPYPGYSFDHGIAFPGGHLGERFQGQTLAQVAVPDGNSPGGPHDVLDGAPDAPLAVAPARPGEGVSLSLHAAYRSMALYPLGPAGQPAPEARGEGAVAVVFHQPVCAVGFRVHTEYTNAFGLNAGHRGEVTLRLYRPDASLIETLRLAPPEGISGHGFLARGPQIGGLTIENRDPGGISLDDLRYGCPSLTG